MTVCPDLRPIGSAEQSFGDGNTVQAGNEALGLLLVYFQYWLTWIFSVF